MLFLHIIVDLHVPVNNIITLSVVMATKEWFSFALFELQIISHCCQHYVFISVFTYGKISLKWIFLAKILRRGSAMIHGDRDINE